MPNHTVQLSENEMLKELIDLASSRGFAMVDRKHYCDIGRNVITGAIEHLGAYESIIFDHDFAKAVFGKEELFKGGRTVEEVKADWKSVYFEGKNRSEVEAKRIMNHDFEYWRKHGNIVPKWNIHLQKLAITPEDQRIKYAYDNRRKQ